MTGRELIIYILENNLVDTEMFPDGVFIGFMNEKEAAVKFDVGVGTIRVWNHMGKVNGFSLGDHLYFYKDMPDPRGRINGKG